MTATTIPQAVDFDDLHFDADGHISYFDYGKPYTLEVGDNQYVIVMDHDTFRTGGDFINDCDESIFGRVSKYAYDYWRDGHTERPDGFTGRARKVQVDRGYWMWWEPPATLWVDDAEVPWEQASNAATLCARQVQDILEYGVHTIVVERKQRCEMGHWHAVDGTALGGVDKPHAEHINDMLHEVSS